MGWWIWIAWWIVFCINIQDYFGYILKKHGENTDRPWVKIYVNKTETELHLKLKMDTVLNF